MYTFVSTLDVLTLKRTTVLVVATHSDGCATDHSIEFNLRGRGNTPLPSSGGRKPGIRVLKIAKSCIMGIARSYAELEVSCTRYLQEIETHASDCILLPFSEFVTHYTNPSRTKTTIWTPCPELLRGFC